jgi:hypothetical protein
MVIGCSYLEEVLSTVDQQSVRTGFVLAVQRIQSKVLSLKSEGEKNISYIVPLTQTTALHTTILL